MKPGPQRRAFPHVSFMIQNLNAFALQLPENVLGAVRGAIVHDNDFLLDRDSLHSLNNQPNGSFFVVSGNDNR